MNEAKVALYIITFNSPKQLEGLINSIKIYDNNFLTKTTKYLLNNSTDDKTFDEYSQICIDYNFNHIKKNNIGICGGRQFIAEHFESTNLDYYYFFEDDMLFVNKQNKQLFCRNGFSRCIENLYEKSLNIMIKEEFDFLKLNFSEFFGNNSNQWAWYNVPQDVRSNLFPDNKYIEINGEKQKQPFLNYKNIKSFDGLPYASGEIFYCNWPQIVSKKGNKKMFIDTKFASPYEQTWMSFIFQETKKNNIYPGILLATPTEHNRFVHYSSNIRKEC
jgi:hypothetical protein